MTGPLGQSWPDPNIEWQYPAESEQNQDAWQRAIDEALRIGTLTLRPGGYKVYRLVGRCPRCGHDLSVEVEVDVILGVDEVDQVARTNVDCPCEEKAHAKAPKDRPGCGWGGPLVVEIAIKTDEPED